MFRQLNEKKGFTLVEVIMALMILAIASTGIYTAISAVRPQAVGSDAEIVAVHMGAKVLGKLCENVHADRWNDPTANLSIGNHTWGTLLLDNAMAFNVVYSVDYTATNARKVNLNVIWN